MRTRIRAAAPALAVVVSLAGCGGFERVDLSELGRAPLGTLSFAGSTEATGKYLYAEGQRTAGPACSAPGAFGHTLNGTPEVVANCAQLVRYGTIDGTYTPTSTFCPGTWEFQNVDVFVQASDCPNLDPLATCYTYDGEDPETPLTSVTINPGSNWIYLACDVEGVAGTFDVLFQ